MPTSRPHLVIAPALLIAACRFDPPPEVEGVHLTYVVSQVSVPTSVAEIQASSLDLDGDGDADNALGQVLGTLATYGLDLQGDTIGAIDRGEIVLLLDLQTTSLSSTDLAGLEVLIGDKLSVMPAPCNGTADTTCRRHLAGTGSFRVATSAPRRPPLTGAITGGTFASGAGAIYLELALGSPPSLPLELIGARAQASGISEAGLQSLILGGAITEADLMLRVLPALHQHFTPLVQADCPSLTPPDCGCPASSTGKTLLGLFDTSPKNCMLSVEEISNQPLFRSLLAPDQVIDGQMGLSFGIVATAVRATIL